MCEMLLTISFNFKLISANCLTLSTRRRRRLAVSGQPAARGGRMEPVSSRDLSPQTKSNHVCATAEDAIRCQKSSRAAEQQNTRTTTNKQPTHNRLILESLRYTQKDIKPSGEQPGRQAGGLVIVLGVI